jgi:hypothetical protein
MKFIHMLLLAVAFSGATAVFAADAPQFPPAAPIPSQILSAKRAFIANAGVDSSVISFIKNFAGSPAGFYNEFYAAMKEWGRYDLVSTPSDADLIFEVHLTQYPYQFGGDPTFDVNIRDPKTQVVLWNFSESIPAGSGREETRRKKFDQAFDTLFADIKSLVMQPVPNAR